MFVYVENNIFYVIMSGCEKQFTPASIRSRNIAMKIEYRPILLREKVVGVYGAK